jgi:hypothetical protein
MGTSKSNAGGTGGAWTDFKRNATLFAKHGGDERIAKTLASYVAAVGGAVAALGTAAAGARAGQSLGAFLTGSTGPTGVAGGLQSVGLGRLVGEDRFTVLSELLDEFVGSGNALDEQAARQALLDVLDELLPEDDTPLEEVHLDEAGVTDTLCRFLSALVYNLAIPVIDERLTRLEDASLAGQRDGELRAYIEGLIRVRLQDLDPIAMDWQGPAGETLIQGVLRDAYELMEEWQ